jgi:hypothetical protein
MKKNFGITMSVLLVLCVLTSCVTTGKNEGAARKVPSNVPEFVKQALMNQPEDAIIGVGTAKLPSVSQSMTIAQTRARADISRQLNTVVKDMVNDYQAASEVDPSAAIGFQEVCTQALSQSTLTGASVVAIDVGPDGAYWAVVSMNNANAAREINQAAAAAKLQVPAMKAFDAQERMQKAFDKIAAEEIRVVDN